MGTLVQTVKTQMKCHILWHFIRVYIVCCEVGTEVNLNLEILTCKPLICTMNYSRLIINVPKIRWKNSLVYKGLRIHIYIFTASLKMNL